MIVLKAMIVVVVSIVVRLVMTMILILVVGFSCSVICMRQLTIVLLPSTATFIIRNVIEER